jgi:hypothetical protein
VNLSRSFLLIRPPRKFYFFLASSAVKKQTYELPAPNLAGSPDSRRFRVVRKLYNIVKNGNSFEAHGRHLLRRWLSERQLAQFDAFNFFDVSGCHSARRHRI